MNFYLRYSYSKTEYVVFYWNLQFQMYSSNEKKQRKYLKLRKAEDDNAFIQQDKLDQQLAAERGMEIKATNLARLARRVASEVSDEKNNLNPKRDKSGVTINNFSEMVQKIIGLDPLTLSKKAKIVWKDLNSAQFRNDLNEFMLGEADQIRNKGLSQTDMMSELLRIAKDAVFGGDRSIEREFEERSRSSSVGSSQSANSIGSTVETSLETLADLGIELPTALRSEEPRLTNIVNSYPKATPTDIRLKGNVVGSKGQFKNLPGNKTMRIDKNNIIFGTYSSQGGFKPYNGQQLLTLNDKLEDLNTQELSNAITELSSTI